MIVSDNDSIYVVERTHTPIDNLVDISTDSHTSARSVSRDDGERLVRVGKFNDGPANVSEINDVVIYAEIPDRVDGRLLNRTELVVPDVQSETFVLDGTNLVKEVFVLLSYIHRGGRVIELVSGRSALDVVSEPDEITVGIGFDFAYQVLKDVLSETGVPDMRVPQEHDTCLCR